MSNVIAQAGSDGSGMGAGILIVGLLIALALAIVPAKIAASKGYSFAAFYVFGLLLWIVAVIVAAVLPRKTGAVG